MENDKKGLSAEVIRKAFFPTENGFVHLVKQALVSRPQLASVGICCLFGVVLTFKEYALCCEFGRLEGSSQVER
uniref:Uncharacterized protein n=1 Tax=Kalanchoe fedtschenkoi TaxID=63787 RepID=A0A7N0TWB2_KALFE